MANPLSIAYYVSAHGYGHGVRSTDIIRALHRLQPDAAITITTDLPASFIRNRLGETPHTMRPGSFDVGMVQRDSIRVDIPASLEQAEELFARRGVLTAMETAFLRKEKANVVVADIPSIPIGAAKQAGVPSVAVGNFAWDWIYGEFVETEPRWQPVIDLLRQDYAKADLLLRLPFADAMSTFPRIEDVPLVARPGRSRRLELSSLTDAREDRTWVLLSFTSLDWSSAALDNVERLTDYDFFTVKPLEWKRSNIHPISRERFPFSDVLASVDIVVSKPGFGLMSECVVNRKPLVFADRTGFREYAVLVEALERHLKHVHIPAARLYDGDLADALEAVRMARAPREPLAAGGDEIAARRILEMAARG